VLLIFLVFCYFLFVCLRPMSCIPNVGSVDCSFLIAPSVFCNVYFLVIIVISLMYWITNTCITVTYSTVEV
jgi:hypothetical protein